MFEWFSFPDEISRTFAIVLIFASFLTSALAAAMGLGGGVALLALMGIGMPVASVLPVHAIVQLGSNLGRTFIQFKYIVWPLVLWFLLGSIVGVAMGGPVVMHIPDTFAKLLLAAFILWSVFGAKIKPASSVSKSYFILGGALTSFASMIVGAAGPMVAALIASKGYTKQTLVATHSVCMVFQHGLKILVFGALGFAFAQWMPMLIAMIASGLAGTYVGTRLLDNLPDHIFRLGFRITMMLLSMQMIWGAFKSFWA
ncbi:MAG: sulfite exporter TauE/SafE family protein [Advenella sp.]|nr:sulfite exporter TauE/SafE family protein [Advenella sp.]